MTQTSSVVLPEDRTDEPILSVSDLTVEFRTEKGVVKAVNGVSYDIYKGESLAILGESGSGKSVSAQAIMGILDTPPGYITGGDITFQGKNMLRMSSQEQRALRGPGIAMVFQDALSALNPVYSVGDQIGEMFVAHKGMSKSDARKKAVELMEKVKIPAAKQRVRDYPHQFSGGMRQRVMIAMAIALNPALLIADEPTTALDVTVQAQIMELLRELQDETGMGLMLITHDLGVVNETVDRVAVMYAGRIVESGTIDDVFINPTHPYTEGLMASIPSLESKGTRLNPIEGNPPDLTRIPSGCAFHLRCPKRVTGTEAEQQGMDCSRNLPLLLEIARGRRCACHYNNKLTTGAGIVL